MQLYASYAYSVICHKQNNCSSSQKSVNLNIISGAISVTVIPILVSTFNMHFNVVHIIVIKIYRCNPHFFKLYLCFSV